MKNALIFLAVFVGLCVAVQIGHVVVVVVEPGKYVPTFHFKIQPTSDIAHADAGPVHK